MDKLEFLTKQFVSHLESISPDSKPVFGKMNVHQMIEHMGYAFQQASGLIPLPSNQDEETTLKMYRFMMSEKAFKDNTPNPFLPDEPPASVHTSLQESLVFLKKDIETFVSTFENNPDKRILNPFFGNLNFEEWTHLLHKHALHHLRQFNVTP